MRSTWIIFAAVALTATACGSGEQASVYDPSGKLLLSFRGQISPSAIPTTLVIDQQGRVAGRVIGVVSKQTLIGMVKDARG